MRIAQDTNLPRVPEITRHNFAHGLFEEAVWVGRLSLLFSMELIVSKHLLASMNKCLMYYGLCMRTNLFAIRNSK